MKTNIAELGASLWQRTAFFRSGAGLAMIAVALVGLRLAWLQLQCPAHLNAIAAAYGSIINLSASPAQFNHDGSKMTYVANTDARGVGVFLCDTATGRKQLMGVQTYGAGEYGNDFNVTAWPWSPDDSAFVYVKGDELVVCSTDTNRASVSLPFDRTNVVSDLVWLNPSEFAFVANHNSFCQAQRQPNGQRELHQFPCGHDLANLTAVGPDEVAWLQDNLICRVKLASDGTNNPFLAQTANAPAPKLPLADNLVLWLDASTLRQPDQSTVENLNDLSASHNNALVNGYAPLFNAPDSPHALNGKGTIHFASNGSPTNATGLKTTKPLGITGAAPRSIFAVMRRDSQAGKSMRISTGNCGQRGEYCGVCDQSYGLWLPAGTITDNAFPALKPAWNVLTVICHDNTEKGFVNGALKGASSFQMNTADAEVELGLRIARSGDPKRTAASDGDFAELLIYDRALDATEQHQVEDYLSTKWFGTRTLAPSRSLVWLDPKTDGITSFDYSKETGQFLLVQSGNGRNSLWRFDPKGSGSDRLTEIQGIPPVRTVQWTGPDTIAYTSSDAKRPGLQSVDVSGKRAAPVLAHDTIGWFKITLDQKRVFFLGQGSDEPIAGIWEYALDSGKLKAVVSGTEHPSPYAKMIPSSVESFQSASGQIVSYTIFPPANFNPHKKYPLVIGDTVIFDKNNKASMAACGAYVALVTRDSWWKGMEDWEPNVRALYDQLKQQPYIDTNRVFMIGTSAETKYMSDCLAQTPGLWRGAIFLEDDVLPDLSKTPLFQNQPRILISSGSEDKREPKFRQFQLDAVKDGVMVEYLVHPGENHVIVGTTAKLVRLQAIAHFIFEE